MKVLVTGATGYIGKHLVDRLITIPNVELVLCARNINELRWGGLQALELDIKVFEDFSIIKGSDYDLLIHLAWGELNDYKSIGHLENEYIHHFSFLKKLIEDGLSNVTILGTCFEYGMQYGELKEDMPTNPTTSYGIAKDTLRRSMELLCATHEVNFKWLRLFYIWGSDQPERTLFGQLKRAVDRGDATFPLSGGEQLRDYLEISEVVERITCIALQDREQGVINCCSGTPISIRNLVEQYVEQLGNPKIDLKWGTVPYAAHEAMAFWGDAKKIKNILNISANRSIQVP